MSNQQVCPTTSRTWMAERIRVVCNVAGNGSGTFAAGSGAAIVHTLHYVLETKYWCKKGKLVLHTGHKVPVTTPANVAHIGPCMKKSSKYSGHSYKDVTALSFSDYCHTRKNITAKDVK